MTAACEILRNACVQVLAAQGRRGRPKRTQGLGIPGKRPQQRLMWEKRRRWKERRRSAQLTLRGVTTFAHAAYTILLDIFNQCARDHAFLLLT